MIPPYHTLGIHIGHPSLDMAVSKPTMLYQHSLKVEYSAFKMTRRPDLPTLQGVNLQVIQGNPFSLPYCSIIFEAQNDAIVRLRQMATLNNQRPWTLNKWPIKPDLDNTTLANLKQLFPPKQGSFMLPLSSGRPGKIRNDPFRPYRSILVISDQRGRSLPLGTLVSDHPWRRICRFRRVSKTLTNVRSV